MKSAFHSPLWTLTTHPGLGKGLRVHFHYINKIAQLVASSHTLWPANTMTWQSLHLSAVLDKQKEPEVDQIHGRLCFFLIWWTPKWGRLLWKKSLHFFCVSVVCLALFPSPVLPSPSFLASFHLDSLAFPPGSSALTYSTLSPFHFLSSSTAIDFFIHHQCTALVMNLPLLFLVSASSLS